MDPLMPNGVEHDAIDYDEMVWDEPADGTRVTVACVRCGAPIEMEYDVGEPTSRNDPGMPATWYPVPDGPCDHVDEYSREEEVALSAAADQLARSREARPIPKERSDAHGE
jgi:hypothetical protein